MDIRGHQNSLAQLQRRAATISGRREVLIERKATLISQIQGAQDLVNSRDQISAALLQMKNKSDFGARQFFEKLLTQFLHEVMPDNHDKIKLTPTNRGSKPSISFDAEVNGELQSIFEDKGGSVKNIVSIGLRFIVLGRTNNRRFVVFDEADCWLKDKYIPRLVSVLNQLASRAKIQVLYVSHHSQEMFSGSARIIELAKVSGEIDARIIERGSETVGGIRSIRLVDFCQHGNTLIELSSGTNVISGDQDLGKSKIVAALDCVAHNAGSTSIIRTGKPSCTVEIGIEEGRTIRWTYLRVGKRRTRYELLDSQGAIIQASDSGTEIPSWIQSYLGMGLINGVDVNLHKQTEPTFLIDSATSAETKAELLSLGQGGDLFNSMIALHAEDQKIARRTVTELTVELGQVKGALTVLRQEILASEKLVAAAAILSAIAETGLKMQRMEQISKMILAGHETVAKLSAVRGLSIINAPEQSTDLLFLQRAIGSLESAAHKVNSLSGARGLDLIVEPALQDSQKLLALGLKLKKLTERISSIAPIAGVGSLAIPTPVDTSAAARLLERMDSNIQAIARLPTEISQAEILAAREQATYMTFLADNELKCPSCHGTVKLEACSHA